MRDLLFVAITIGFFLLCVAYVGVCDRIIGPDPDDLDEVDPADIEPVEADADAGAEAHRPRRAVNA